MRRIVLSAAALLALTVGSSIAAHAAPDGWHANLKAGLEASAKSGRPLLVITAWARTL